MLDTCGAAVLMADQATHTHLAGQRERASIFDTKVDKSDCSYTPPGGQGSNLSLPVYNDKSTLLLKLIKKPPEQLE